MSRSSRWSWRHRFRRNKYLDWALLALIVLAISYGSSLLPGGNLSGRVKVIDGDSLYLGDAEIRLYGIDAPEGRQTCTDAAGNAYRCGRNAARELRRLVGGRKVDCEIVDTDRYDRSLARCMAGDLDINREMVRRGWAVAYRNTLGEFAAEEREARRARRGLWQGLFDRPQDWRRLNAAKAGAAAGAANLD